MESLDVTAAFLQADAIERDVWIKPPKDTAKTGIVWKLKRPVYGLEDSARQWYNTLKDTVTKLGCRMSMLDKSLFCFYGDSPRLQGMFVTHVDDIIYAGSQKFKDIIIKPILAKFKISKMASGIFQYLGWTITQDKDCIRVDQNKYAKTIIPVVLESKRKNQLEEFLTESEVKQYQKLLGQLLWLSSQTRPDLSYDTLEHSTHGKKLQVKHLKSLNKVVKRLHEGPEHLTFNCMDLRKDQLKLVAYSDASLANLPNRTDSCRGFILFLGNGNGKSSVLTWSARLCPSSARKH